MSVDQTELRERWRGVVRHYPVWRMLFDLTFDPASWRLVGSDVVSLVVQGKTARRAARALEGASAEMLTALTAMAEVNVRRTGDLFRVVFLGYVSVPLAIAAMLSDAAPEALRAMLTEMTASLIVFLIGALVFPIVYFCGSWRARQIGWVIDLYRAGALAPLPEKNAVAGAPT
ncbi:MAG TPA: hypothetical protein VEA80_10085 [Vitreimonas sp.]|uniref:hypothetical protein n=1 Tax=Vitreimonas sp. TaxID=3069702 RepID=UPI002D67F42E|nr:hypothetical protein [Vitreimonas sp.]HYD87813.1 hypothetical protein [Vitreimonas sp.]